MLQVIQDNKRLIQKDLLSFSWRNAVLDVFLLIALVPFKTGYLFKWPHYSSLYMVKIYTRTKSLASRLFNQDVTYLSQQLSKLYLELHEVLLMIAGVIVVPGCGTNSQTGSRSKASKSEG
jgi:hypothetical protein